MRHLVESNSTLPNTIFHVHSKGKKLQKKEIGTAHTWQYPTSESRKEYATSTRLRAACPSGVSNQAWPGKVLGRSCNFICEKQIRNRIKKITNNVTPRLHQTNNGTRNCWICKQITSISQTVKIYKVGLESLNCIEERTIQARIVCISDQAYTREHIHYLQELTLTNPIVILMVVNIDRSCKCFTTHESFLTLIVIHK